MKKNKTAKSFLEKRTSVLLAIVLTIALLCVTLISVTAAEQSVSLTSAEDLLKLMNDSKAWSKNYTLSNDIDLSSYEGELLQAPIGDMTSGENVYYAGLIRFDMTPKPAYYTLKKLLYETWHTEADMTTSEDGKASFRGFYGDYTVEIEIDGVVTTHSVSLSKGADNNFTIKAQ